MDYTPEAEAKARKIEADPDLAKMGVCMVKTHLSLTDNPVLKGVPKGWRLRIRDILTYKGAGFVVPRCRDHYAHAGDFVRPGLPPRGCGCGDREGQGRVLENNVQGSKFKKARAGYPARAFAL